VRHAFAAATAAVFIAIAPLAPANALGRGPPPPPPRAIPHPGVDDARILAVRIPAQLASGAPATIEVDVQNTGSTTWTSDVFKLGVVGDQKGSGARFLGGVSGQDSVRIWLPKGTTVAPGAKHTFSAPVVGPKPGLYVLQLRMVHELVRWFGGTATQLVIVTPSAPAPPAPAPTPSPAPAPANGDDAKVTAIRIPSQAAPGAPVHFEVDVTNAGTTTWTHDSHKLGVVGDASGDAFLFLSGVPGQDPGRIWLAPGATVGPGSVTTFSADGVAPSQPRKYAIRFQMVHEGVAWFGAIAEQSLEVIASAPPTPPPSSNVVLEDPLAGSTKGTQVGGTLLPDGFRIDNPDDHITYEVPKLTDGAIELSVRGLQKGIPAGAVEDAELIVMYDGTYSPDPERDYLGFRNNPYKFLLRKRDTDAVKVVLRTPGGEIEDSSAPLAWDPSATYRFRVEWGGGSARVYRDGQLVKAVSPGGTWSPAKHRIRVGDGGASRGWKGVVSSKLVVTSGSATPPPSTPPPIPGTGPMPARDTANPLHLIDAKTGKPFFWVGKTAFGLSAQPRWREFIDEAEQNGITVLRVLVGGGKGASASWALPYPLWPFLGNGSPDPAHFQRLDDVVAYAGQKNMAVELVVFECGLCGDMTNPTSYDAAKQQYVSFVVNRYRSAPNVIWEVANEYSHAGCGANPYNGLPDQLVTDVARDIGRLDGSHLIGLSDQGGTSFPRPTFDPAFTISNIHIDRSGDFWKRPWDIFRANTSIGKPMINDEPMGSDVQSSGNRDSDGTKHRADAWISAIAGGYFTFHCQLGLAATPGAQPGQADLKAFRDFFDSIGINAFSPSLDIVKGSGANEAYGCRDKDDEFLVYLRDGDLTKPLTLLLPPGTFDVRVIEPASGRTLATTTVAGGANADVALGGATKDVAVHAKRR
jgi:hypothetical protein